MQRNLGPRVHSPPGHEHDRQQQQQQQRYTSTSSSSRRQKKRHHTIPTRARLVTVSAVEYPRITVPHSLAVRTSIKVSASPTPPPSSSSSYSTLSANRRSVITIHTFLLSNQVSANMAHSKEEYAQVAEAIKKILPKEDYDDGSTGPVLVRLAWHASGTYDKATGTGGSNGATMRYKLESADDANAGLEYARKFLEPVKEQFPWITYADLWTFAGAVAIEALGGPHIPWKPGRVDYVDEANVPPNGRLPDGSKGQDHLRDIFYRMGFNDQEIVALCGAHNLGRTHANRSGFDGPWVPNPTQFNNTYYKLLLNEEWKLGKSPAGVEQFYDPDQELMMLPADMSLINDPKFREWVEKYAKDKDLFYDHFSKAFAKLLELGVRRDKSGIAQINLINQINNPEASKL